MNAKYRHDLPQLKGDLFLTDAGLETTLVFHHGIDLPLFASFTLLGDSEGRSVMKDEYRRYAAIALAAGRGCVFETPTWRASRDWGYQLGIGRDGLAAANRDGVAMIAEIRAEVEPQIPLVISGNLGPRGDGYRPDALETVESAHAYHAEQVRTLAETEADMVSALTMTHWEEAAGIALAARDMDIPCALSFTVETDGHLPSGQPLGEAIESVDAATDGSPVYYMINCAHPDHFAARLEAGGRWIERLRGIRANASRCSHAELDAAEELDDGNPEELGAQYRELVALLPNLAVVGGCCGTDHRHVEAISNACGRIAQAA